MKPEMTMTGHVSPWRMPFTAEPWRRTAYVLLAPFAGLAAVADGGRLQRRLAAALLGRDMPMMRLRGLLALPQRRDGHLVRRGLVAPRPVREDVPHGGEAELAELPLRRRCDSLQRVERDLEALGASGTRRGGPIPRLVQACKDRLSTGGCHRPRHRAG